MLVIDAANVVGSRPDGWWKDRPGAARRFVDELAAAGITGLVVLEGAARAGADPGRHGTVEVVHADGEGDDTLAALATDGVTLVTADRELSRRARAAGAEVVGPRWLLDQLR